MNDIPDWAGKRACELLNNEMASSPYKWPQDAELANVRTVAKLVMQHEQPPVDPDEEAVKRIFKAWGPDTDWDDPIATYPDDFARAVSQYKQEKANG